MIDFEKSPDEAVNQPRIHFENDLLSIEPGFDADVVCALADTYGRCKTWDRQNLFFGGVHTVTEYQGSFDGAGDRRRDGVACIVH